MSDSNWTAMSFFPEAEKRIGAEGVVRLRRVFQFLRERGKIKWGPITNKNGGFRVVLTGFGSNEIIHGFADGNLVIWHGRLNLDNSAHRDLFDRLRVLSERFECNIDNPSRFELPIERWGDRIDELLGMFPELVKPGKAS